MDRLHTTARLIVSFCAAAALATIGTAFAANPDHIEQLKNTNACSLCNLEEAQLSGFTFSGADLSGANLANAQMYGTNLSGANLAGAILQGANLRMANLTGAKDAALSGAQTDERTICPSGDHGPCQ